MASTEADTDEARATKPKSAGTSSCVSISRLTKPISLLTMRQPASQLVPISTRRLIEDGSTTSSVILHRAPRPPWKQQAQGMIGGPRGINRLAFPIRCWRSDGHRYHAFFQLDCSRNRTAPLRKASLCSGERQSVSCRWRRAVRKSQ